MLKPVVFALLCVCGLSTGAAEPLSNEDYERVCKATIATIFNRPIDGIWVDAIEIKPRTPRVLFLAYIRQPDQTEWKTKCKVDGDTVIWGAADGRWRTHPRDEKYTFSVERTAGTVTVREHHEDRITRVRTYPLRN